MVGSDLLSCQGQYPAECSYLQGSQVSNGYHRPMDAHATCSTSAPHDVYDAQCPCRGVLDLLADKWSALVIGALESGPQRFGQLKTRLAGVSPKVLTATLRRLEDRGILSREVFAEVPVRVEYSLTPLGADANRPLRELRLWVESNISRFPA